MADTGKLRNWSLPAIIVILIVVNLLVEVVMIAGDSGILDMVRFRATVYEYGGFWPGLLSDWRPNYAYQPAIMFLSYSFLHGGPVHLIVNMVTLASVGPPIVDRVGPAKFAIIYIAAVIGGGLAFAALGDTFRPMVGASGALFGLAGAVLAWEYVDRFTFSAKLWPVVRAVGLLILLNIVLFYAMDGLLAWETHLGGFICGWIAAMLVDPRGRSDQLG